MLFLQAVVKRGRQQLFCARSQASITRCVDVKLNRVRAGVTLARPADEALQRAIQDALSKQLGKEVLRDVLGRLRRSWAARSCGWASGSTTARCGGG